MQHVPQWMSKGSTKNNCTRWRKTIISINKYLLQKWTNFRSNNITGPRNPIPWGIWSFSTVQQPFRPGLPLNKTLPWMISYIFSTSMTEKRAWLQHLRHNPRLHMSKPASQGASRNTSGVRRWWLNPLRSILIFPIGTHSFELFHWRPNPN
jgi:hypothetical protein